MTTFIELLSMLWHTIEHYYIMLILGIPIFFIWQWLFKKFIKVDQTRKITTWVVTICSTPIIYVGLIMLFLFSVSYHPSYEFDKERWAANKEKRYQLSEHIIESKMLIGKTKAEVKQILGDADHSDDLNNWDYHLGFRPALFSIDIDILDIEFKEGKVVKVWQHQS
jgi:hypothetical protein